MDGLDIISFASGMAAGTGLVIISIIMVILLAALSDADRYAERKEHENEMQETETVPKQVWEPESAVEWRHFRQPARAGQMAGAETPGESWESLIAEAAGEIYSDPSAEG